MCCELCIVYIYTNKSSYNLRYHSFRFQSRGKADLDYDPEFHRNDRRLLIQYDHFWSFHKSAWIKDEIIVKRKWEMSLVLIEKHSNFLFLKFVFLFSILDDVAENPSILFLFLTHTIKDLRNRRSTRRRTKHVQCQYLTNNLFFVLIITHTWTHT